jgi:hypothetical protein
MFLYHLFQVSDDIVLTDLNKATVAKSVLASYGRVRRPSELFPVTLSLLFPRMQNLQFV